MVYVIVAVPAVMPLTKPVAAPIVAVVTELQLHVPPAVGLVRAMVLLTHSPDAPLIAPGCGLTVIAFVVVQPVPNE